MIKIFWVFFICYLNASAQETFFKEKKIIEIPSKGIERWKCTFIKDGNVYFFQDRSIALNNQNSTDKLNLKFFYYNDSISLDKIYRDWQKGKQNYAPGFIDADYEIIGDEIKFNINFINEATNTSRSTAHSFAIVCNRKSKKIESIRLIFTND